MKLIPISSIVAHVDRQSWSLPRPSLAQSTPAIVVDLPAMRRQAGVELLAELCEEHGWIESAAPAGPGPGLRLVAGGLPAGARARPGGGDPPRECVCRGRSSVRVEAIFFDVPGLLTV